MIRLLINIGLSLLANAIGLIVAAAILDDMGLGASGFVIAVLIFTGVMVLVRPMITKVAITHAQSLGGSSALIAVLVALIATTIISDSLTIDGLATWFLATVIIWAATLLGGFLLPWILLRKHRENKQGNAEAANVRTWG